MTTQELIKAVKEINEICKKFANDNIDCGQCPFCKDGKCVFVFPLDICWPDHWEVEKLEG